jgi:hypothetical protein
MRTWLSSDVSSQPAMEHTRLTSGACRDMFRSRTYRGSASLSGERMWTESNVNRSAGGQQAKR